MSLLYDLASAGSREPASAFGVAQRSLALHAMVEVMGLTAYACWQESTAMQQWEYREIRGPKLQDELNTHAQEGWELQQVVVIPSSGSGAPALLVAFLRRQTQKGIDDY
jgi:hypothetical protein